MSADEQVGRTLGPYRIERLLAQGSAGKVYLARHEQLDREVALKLLGTFEGQALARFEREAKAAARVQDPHVATVFDFGAEGGTRYIAQEYVEGESLAARQARARLTPEEWIPVGIGLAAGLSAIHRADLIHRDLKPHNIILGEGRSPKIVDFGLVKVQTDGKQLTRQGLLLGTPLYMAPEQIGLRDEGLSPAADIYALGCVLHEGLTGHVPHDTGDKDLKAFLARRSQEEVTPDALPAGTPPALAALVTRMLAADPAERPDAREVQRELVALRAPRRRPPPTAPRKPMAPVPIGMLLALGGLVVVLSFLGALLALREDPPTAAETASPAPSTPTSEPPLEPAKTPASPPPAKTRAKTKQPPPAKTITPPPAESKPAQTDPLARALAALRKLELKTAQAVLDGIGRGDDREVAAARRLLEILRAVNGDAKIRPRVGWGARKWADSPRTAAVVNEFGAELAFYLGARMAAERQRPFGLAMSLRRYQWTLRMQGRKPAEARFLLAKRRPEQKLLLGLSQAAALYRREPERAKGVLKGLLGSKPAETPLGKRLAPWIRAWGNSPR